MRKKFIGIMLSVLICLMVVPFHMFVFAEDEYCPFSGGKGTESEPYQIKTAYDLFLLAELINDIDETKKYRSSYYIQTADIDLKGENWIPIGTWGGDWECAFSGSYNGNYHSVSNYTLNYDGEFSGIFGRIGLGGNAHTDYCVVKNLSVYNSFDTNGTNLVGGIVGEVGYGASIENCSFFGKINAESAKNVGGIAGGIWCGGEIKSCYVNANIESKAVSGGIIGLVQVGGNNNNGSVNAEIRNSYYTGTVNGNIEGAIAGNTMINTQNGSFAISFANNYFLDSACDGAVNGANYQGCQKMDSDFMKNINELLESPFVFNADETLNDGYPVFEWQATPYQFKGSGTEADPYQISSKEELVAMRNLVNSTYFGNEYCRKYYIQTADIDLENEQWIPIGKRMKNGLDLAIQPFRGNYNGNYHSVINLYVNETEKFSGLFGSLNNGGMIENLEVQGTVISTAESVGGVCGEIGNGIIRNCCFIGDVTGGTTSTGNGSTGGITGYLYQSGLIQNCYHNGNITCENNATGGIVGRITVGTQSDGSATVENCYHVGKITGMPERAGTIAGLMDMGKEYKGNIYIKNCYALNGNCNNNITVNGASTECNVLVQTSSQLKAIAEDLGNEYITNPDSNFNNGYPIFYWQTSFMGDVNHDGSFTVLDIVILQKWLHSSGHLEKWQNADFNGDGIINVYDLCLMKRALLNKN
ncbi:MAG: hypothetical protein K2H29_09955 [Oscillospiraceae bacterium]|nr:hypothetical protein [Oscillospiraceae bacterium]